MSEYVPVPVDAARQIAHQFAKDIVVVVSVDREHEQVHTTTYGRKEFDKIHAAELGPVLANAAGAFIPAAQFFEDFRDQAQSAEKYDKLLARHDVLVGTLRGLLGMCEMPSETRQRVEELVNTEVRA